MDNLCRGEERRWCLITSKKNRMYGELMREMSSVRCETWTEEEEDREKLKDAGQVTRLY